MILTVPLEKFGSGSAEVNIHVGDTFGAGDVKWHIQTVREIPADKRRKPVFHEPGHYCRVDQRFYRQLLGDELYDAVLLAAWRQICPVPDKMKEGTQDD